MSQLTITWFCTHCHFEHDYDVDTSQSLESIVDAGKRDHAESSPKCVKGEIYFETEFVSADLAKS